MKIQQLRPIDAAEYRELMLEGYRDFPAAFTSSFDERTQLPLHWWEARLSGENMWILGARTLDSGLAGCVGLSMSNGSKTRHKAALFGMFVRPGSAGDGVGSQLIEAVLALLNDHPQITAITLSVSAGNTAAMALYEKYGFIEYGVEPWAIQLNGSYIAKHELWKPLKLAE